MKHLITKNKKLSYLFFSCIVLLLAGLSFGFEQVHAQTDPSISPSIGPSSIPTDIPTELPTASPTDLPTAMPTEQPTDTPTTVPTASPTPIPTVACPPLPANTGTVTTTVTIGTSKRHILSGVEFLHPIPTLPLIISRLITNAA